MSLLMVDFGGVDVQVKMLYHILSQYLNTFSVNHAYARKIWRWLRVDKHH